MKGLSNVIIISAIVSISLCSLSFTPNSFAAFEYNVVSSPESITFGECRLPPPDFPNDTRFFNFTYNQNGIGTVEVDDYFNNLSCSVKDFTSGVLVQPSSTTTVDLDETGINTGMFKGNFLVTDNIPTIEYSETLDPEALWSYAFGPENGALGRIDIPDGFAGTLTFEDYRVTDVEADATCFWPVTGAIKITGTLNVQPNIVLSYANANFTGVAATSNAGNLGMYYKHPGQQFEIITLPVIPDGFNFINTVEQTIESKNSDDPAGTTTPAGILIPGGWNGVSDYQGVYVLGIDNGCSGGGGGGLVRPSLVVNALAGLGASGGGSAYSSPTLQLSNLVQLGQIEVPLEVEQMILNHDSKVPTPAMELNYFDNFDYPLIINDKGFVLSGFSTTLETQTLETNTPHTFKFMYYESEKIQHFSLYTNLRDSNTEIHQSDTQILYFDGQEIEVVDPNGYFEDVSFTLNEIDDLKKEIILEIIFAKPMDTTDMVLRSWDPLLNSFDTHILDAFNVVSDNELESPISTYEEPMVQELKSETIPIWVKNNAAWWSNQQIGDDDFVEGIEYLIKNGIIKVPGVEDRASSATADIPDWIKNNAGWWSESLITDDDFIEAMQWLISNGVIQI